MKRGLKNARAIAARVLTDVVIQGKSLDAALAQTEQYSSGPASDRSLIQEIAYGCMRWYLYLDAITSKLLERDLKKKDQDLRLLILVGLYQLHYLSVKPHAAVSETVAATKELGKPWAKGLVNGCLRNFQRNQQSLLKAVAEAIPDIELSHPQWLLSELKHCWPQHWRAIAESNNQRPPMHLRVNLARIGRETTLEALAAVGIEADILSTPGGIALAQPQPVELLPGFNDGHLSVQDVSAQYAALLLDPQPGEQLLDACAAPGGKTGHLLEQVRGEAKLVAIDRDPARAERIRENLERLGLSAVIQVADAAEPDGWWDKQPFDRILLDAPCSATGVIRRHPDIKFHRQPADVDQLVQTQASLLDALWPLVRQGGKLLYATCSIIRRENELQIKAFLDQHDDAAELPLALRGDVDCAHGVQLLPGEGDGFYYCLLEKR